MDTPTGIVDRISSTYYPLSAEAKEKIASILVRTELKKNTLFRQKRGSEGEDRLNIGPYGIEEKHALQAERRGSGSDVFHL